jgi:hypothetical protein
LCLLKRIPDFEHKKTHSSFSATVHQELPNLFGTFCIFVQKGQHFVFGRETDTQRQVIIVSSGHALSSALSGLIALEDANKIFECSTGVVANVAVNAGNKEKRLR